MGISPTQLIIILVIVALLFGTKKLRGIGGDLGGAVKGFKNAMKDEKSAPKEQIEHRESDESVKVVDVTTVKKTEA